MRTETIDIGTLPLVNGHLLEGVRQRFTTYGEHDGRPVVLVAHALTGSSDAADWWPGIVGDGAFFDPRTHYIVCINALGSCYGSTGPSTRDPFPPLAMRDVVAAQARVLDALNVERIDIAIGGSLGGMQALQWAVSHPSRVRRAIIVGAADHQSAMGIALGSLQREAIALGGDAGLGLARKIAMLSYKSDVLFALRHDRMPDRADASRYDIEGYLDLHARRFTGRMDARTYVALSLLMDSFDARECAVAPHDAPTLDFIGIGNDWLFPQRIVAESAQRYARAGWNARYHAFESEHGHDAFLAETTALRQLLHTVVNDS